MSSQLVEVSQNFVDAVAVHNGRPIPRPQPPKEVKEKVVATKTRAAVVNDGLCDGKQKLVVKLLAIITPDVGYEDWFKCGAIVHHEFNGSDAGFEVFDQWSQKSTKYDPLAIERLWKSLGGYSGDGYTIASLYKLAESLGTPYEDLPQEDDFEVIESPPSETTEVLKKITTIPSNPLDKFSLNGLSSQYRQQMEEDEFVLDGIALSGQVTNVYASPGAGKTLLTMWLLMNLLKAQK